MLLEREHVKTAVWAAAVDQERVLVLGETLQAAQQSINDFLDVIPEGFPAEVRRLNGKHSITFPRGGTIRFLSERSSSRGMSFDRAYIPVSTGQDARADVHIAMATSKVGILTEYGRRPDEPYCDHGPFDACRCAAQGVDDSRVTAG